MKSKETIEQLGAALNETGVRTALVRGETAPSRPPATVTVAPGAVASLGAAYRRAPLYVTAETPGGRTVRRYDGEDVRAAADRADALVADREPTAVWLCARDCIETWWSEGVVELLERRLSDAADAADAPLVVWTDERNAAVGDRYDVVLDP